MGVGPAVMLAGPTKGKYLSPSPRENSPPPSRRSISKTSQYRLRSVGDGEPESPLSLDAQPNPNSSPPPPSLCTNAIHAGETDHFRIPPPYSSLRFLGPSGSRSPIALRRALSATGDEEGGPATRKRRREPQSSPSISGALPYVGSGRRSFVETAAIAVGSSRFQSSSGGNNPNVRDYSSSYEPYHSGLDRNAGVAEYHEVYGNYRTVDGSDVSCYGGSEDCSNIGECGNCADYSDYPLWHRLGCCRRRVRVSGERGRNELPAKIAELKWAELMKNRLREDE